MKDIVGIVARIIALLVLSIFLGVIVWKAIGANYAVVVTPFIFLLFVLTEFEICG